MIILITKTTAVARFNNQERSALIRITKIKYSLVYSFKALEIKSSTEKKKYLENLKRHVCEFERLKLDSYKMHFGII